MQVAAHQPTRAEEVFVHDDPPTELRLEIPRSGPPVVSKWKLAVALLEFRSGQILQIPYTTTPEIAGALSIPQSGTLNVSLLSVEAEDGSGESWNLQGYGWHGERGQNPQRRVTIYTRTDNATGVIIFNK